MNEPINWGVVASFVVPIVVASLGAWGYYVSHRAQKGTPEHALIDQLQEQLDRADARSDKQDARMEKIEAELGRFKKREQIRDEYINKLRRHIEAGMPPPPPPWPDGLYD
jgi:hypothetical protein